MILLFTDFGAGPYMGQIEVRLYEEGIRDPVIRLMHDAPNFDAEASGLLLEALLADLPEGGAVLGVVDPGVGGSRQVISVLADGRRFVGPDNGLFAPLMKSASNVLVERIDWRPESLAPTFHARDLFAPALARLHLGRDLAVSELDPGSLCGMTSTVNRSRVIYVDDFGNLWTGLQADLVDPAIKLRVGLLALSNVRTFGDREVGSVFWFENSSGLVEIAVNQGSAATLLKAVVGTPVELVD